MIDEDCFLVEEVYIITCPDGTETIEYSVEGMEAALNNYYGDAAVHDTFRVRKETHYTVRRYEG